MPVLPVKHQCCGSIGSNVGTHACRDKLRRATDWPAIQPTPRVHVPDAWKFPAPVHPRVYLAGPMSGLPDLNFPAFHAAATSLRGFGFDVVNPAELNPEKDKPWAECMRVDIAQLVTCQGIALLPGWEKSKGARLESQIASDLKMFRVLLGE